MDIANPRALVVGSPLDRASNFLHQGHPQGPSFITNDQPALALTNKVAHSPRGLVPQCAFRIARRAASLGCIEADESHIRLLMKYADCIAIDDANV